MKECSVENINHKIKYTSKIVNRQIPDESGFPACSEIKIIISMGGELLR